MEKEFIRTVTIPLQEYNNLLLTEKAFLEKSIITYDGWGGRCVRALPENEVMAEFKKITDSCHEKIRQLEAQLKSPLV